MPSNAPTSWLWDFGDGNTSTLENPEHIYAVPGTYTVTLTSKNSAGSSTAVKQFLVTVTSTQHVVGGPDISFTATPLVGSTPLVVQFTDQSTLSPIRWVWNFGDGNTSTDQNPSHTYVTAGTFDVSLTATNTVGTNTGTQIGYVTVAVASLVPVAAFNVSPPSGVVPFTASFVDISTNNPTSWLWNFGDGSPTSVLQNPQHVYASPGVYTVTLTVSNQYGSNTITKTALINATALAVVPTAGFVATPTVGSSPLAVQFTDTSQGIPTSWHWDFGDGTFSNVQNP